MVPVVKLFLCASYAALLVYLLAMLVVMIRGGHRTKSFTTVFFVLSSVWMLSRAVFWLGTAGLYRLSASSDGALFVSFWIPTALQFSVFSLVALFYAKVLLGRRWRDRRVCLFLVYLALNGALLATSVILAVLAGTATDAGRREDLQAAFLTFAGALYLTLAAAMLALTVLLARLDVYAAMGVFHFRRRTVAGLNAVLCAVFFARGLFNLLSAADLVSFSVPLTAEEDVTPLDIPFLLATEFVPTLLLLLTIARLPCSCALLCPGSAAASPAGAPRRDSLLPPADASPGGEAPGTPLYGAWGPEAVRWGDDPYGDVMGGRATDTESGRGGDDSRSSSPAAGFQPGMHPDDGGFATSASQSSL